jgi:hypothetical protein
VLGDLFTARAESKNSVARGTPANAEIPSSRLPGQLTEGTRTSALCAPLDQTTQSGQGSGRLLSKSPACLIALVVSVSGVEGLTSAQIIRVFVDLMGVVCRKLYNYVYFTSHCPSMVNRYNFLRNSEFYSQAF